MSLVSGYLKPDFSLNKTQASVQVDEEPIESVTGGRKYKIVAREYGPRSWRLFYAH